LRNAGAPAAPFFAICLHYKISKEVLQVIKNAFYFFVEIFQKFAQFGERP